jgi:hypothetical protein
VQEQQRHRVVDARVGIEDHLVHSRQSS